jgi:DNA-directed RNA polymerase subunit RPC12/RpoP
MQRDHIEIRCPNCGRRMLIQWPTPRERRAKVICRDCETDFHVAQAVERTVIGARDERDLHIVRKRPTDPTSHLLNRSALPVAPE